MRVSCLQENLAKGLAIVGRAVSSRSTMPVLANILIEASDNQLRLAATNLEIGINCWIAANSARASAGKEANHAIWSSERGDLGFIYWLQNAIEPSTRRCRARPSVGTT